MEEENKSTSSMGKRKFDLVQIGRFRSFLEDNRPISWIIEHFKNSGVVVSRSYLSKMKHGKIGNDSIGNKKNRGRKEKLSNYQLRSLKVLLSKEHPPTLRDMASKFNVSHVNSGSHYLRRTCINGRKCKLEPCLHEEVVEVNDELYRDIGTPFAETTLTRDEYSKQRHTLRHSFVFMSVKNGYT